MTDANEKFVQAFREYTRRPEAFTIMDEEIREKLFAAAREWAAARAVEIHTIEHARQLEAEAAVGRAYMKLMGRDPKTRWDMDEIETAIEALRALQEKTDGQ